MAIVVLAQHKQKRGRFSMSTNNKVQVGDRAPIFSLRTQDGSTVSLEDFLGKKSVVLYFYPKDNGTPVNIGE
jgi:peroxiredoxin